jgi:hypothetical protein
MHKCYAFSLKKKNYQVPQSSSKNQSMSASSANSKPNDQDASGNYSNANFSRPNGSNPEGSNSTSDASMTAANSSGTSQDNSRSLLDSNTPIVCQNQKLQKSAVLDQVKTGVAQIQRCHQIRQTPNNPPEHQMQLLQILTPLQLGCKLNFVLRPDISMIVLRTAQVHHVKRTRNAFR